MRTNNFAQAGGPGGRGGGGGTLLILGMLSPLTFCANNN